MTTPNNIRAKIHPSTKPTTILLTLTLGIVALVVGVAMGYRENIGTDVSNFLVAVTAIVGGLVVARLLVRYYVLKRTKYVITNRDLRRQFQLFYKVQEREVPIARLRGIQLRQGRLQSFLGIGDLTFLTAGTNQSLGFLKFEAIPEPAEQRAELRTQLWEASSRAVSSGESTDADDETQDTATQTSASAE